MEKNVWEWLFTLCKKIESLLNLIVPTTILKNQINEKFACRNPVETDKTFSRISKVIICIFYGNLVTNC